MFPIRDHNPSRRTPFVTIALIAVNVIVFLYTWPLMSDERALKAFYGQYALVPDFVSHGHNLQSIFTSMFLHGSFMHIAGNMLFLWVFGDNLEDELGHVRFFGFYILSGVGAAALQIVADPSSQVPMVGASGAIAGVLGGYLLLYPKARVDVLFIFVIIFKIWPIPAWIVLGFWFGSQLFNGLGSLGVDGGVAYLAHVGGFVTGFAMILPVWLSHGGTGFWQQSAGRPMHRPTEYRLQRSSVPTVRRRR